MVIENILYCFIGFGLGWFSGLILIGYFSDDEK